MWPNIKRLKVKLLSRDKDWMLSSSAVLESVLLAGMMRCVFRIYSSRLMDV